jgi:alpha-beta hydrolase superfamily lysophospholipase
VADAPSFLKRTFMPWKYASRRAWRARLVLGGVGLLMMIPVPFATRLEPLSRQYPLIDDRTHRAPTSGCGLACGNGSVSGVREEEVTFASSAPAKGVARLRGVLHLPEGVTGPRPGLIILHGSGPVDRDGTLEGDLVSRHRAFGVYKALADFFAREGIVVLRWDKRARIHYPDLDQPEASARFEYSDFALDGRDALAFLASRPEVDPNALIVVGHSEGGLFAPAVAADDPRVAAVILLSAFIDVFDAAAGQEDDFARIRLRQGDVLGWMTLRVSAWAARRSIARAMSGTAPDREALGGLTDRQLAAAIHYTEATQDRLRALRPPVFAIQGSVDRNIDPSTIPRLRDVLAGHDFEVHYVAGMSHSLVDVLHDADRPALAEPLRSTLHAFLASVTLKGK